MNKNELFFDFAYSILTFIFVIFLLSFTGFIFHISINIFYPIISYLFSLGVLFLLLKKQNFSNKCIIFSILGLSFIYILSFMLIGAKLDSSWDGREYHQLGTILMANGLNPIYDNVNEFAQNLIGSNNIFTLWVECYPKFAEIFAANILVLTNHIECGKVFNLLSLIVLFLYSMYVFSRGSYAKINNFQRVIISLLMALNPVVLGQILTFNIDGLVYIYFMLMLLAIIDIENTSNKTFLTYSVLIMSSVCLINVKLGGILCFLISTIVYIFYLIITKQKDSLKKFLLSIFLIGFLSLLSGINPYFTNLKQNRHPFYPLMGANKVDIMTSNTPAILMNNSPLTNFFISTFNRCESGASEIKLNLKFPYTIYESEFAHLEYSGPRISGFGVLWSGIFCLSFIMMFFLRYNSKEEKKRALLIFSILFLLLVVNPYSWWARYIPHLWSVPLFISIYLIVMNDKKIVKILVSLLLLTMVVNQVLQFICISKHERHYRRLINNTFKEIDCSKPIKMYGTREWSFLQKLKERNIKYVLVDEEFYQQNKSAFYYLPYGIVDSETGALYWNVKRNP